MNQPVRNLVVAIGQFGSGKTETRKHLRQELKGLGISLHAHPIIDGDYIIEEIKNDDTRGGLNHTHDWCEHGKLGHAHDRTHPEPTPFFALTNEITDPTIGKTLEAMVRAPEDRIVLVEVGIGGRNLNPPEVSQVDLSWGRVIERFNNGELPKAALERVLAVVLPQTTLEGRIARNEQRRGKTFSDAEVQRGDASWYVEEAAMLITGRNEDFVDLRRLLENHGVPIIVEFNNNPGSQELLPTARLVTEQVASLWRDREGKVVGENTPRAPERV